MKVLYDLSEDNKNLALALGFFDGVHLGHQEVIKSAVNYARENQTKSAVITFKEHPQVVLRGVAPAYISTKEKKYQKLENLGVDFCYELDFADVCKLSGVNYIEQFLVKNFSPISISTGFNHNFGYAKSGTTELLDDKSYEFGYKYFLVAPVSIDEETVSSSLIRKKLTNADLYSAKKMLGEDFSICGVVQKGASIARKIGYKTANVFYPQNVLQLPFGVYKVVVNLNGQNYLGIANFGVKPTFEKLTEKPLLEIHILGFDDEIYDEVLDVKFLEFIREERKFSSAQELIKQIELDMKKFV